MKLLKWPITLDLCRKARCTGNLLYQLPKHNLSELFPGIEAMAVTIPCSHIFGEPGTLPLRELVVLAGICKHLKPQKMK